MIEGNRSSTKENAFSNNPVWNEVSAFDIEQGQDVLQVQVLDCRPDDGNNPIGDRNKQVIGEVQIGLKDLSYEQQEWMNKWPGK